MIRLKRDDEFLNIEHSIEIGENILTRISKYMKSGITPTWIDKKVGFLLLLNRSKASFKGYQSFPANTCVSVNTEIIHCIPDNTPFKSGDIVKVDLGVDYKDYKSDQARTYIIDLKPNNTQDFKLLYATKTALDRAISVAKRDNYIRDISSAIESTAKEFGVGILKNWGGHGVGYEVHEPPSVPNKIGRDANIKLKRGMVLAIEPMFVLGKGNYIQTGLMGIEADGISAHFEKTIIIK